MLLARYCSAPYSLVTHSCKLHSLGMPAADVLRLLQEPTPSAGEDLERLIRMFCVTPRPLVDWPEEGSGA